MLSVVMMRRWLFMMGACLAAFAGHATAAEARLRVATSKGPAFEHFAVRNGAIVLLDDGGEQPVPEGAQWRFDGDLAALAAQIFWTEDYTLQRRELPDDDAEAKTRPMGAIVSLQASEDVGWPASALADGLVVFLWVNDARVVQIVPAVARPGKLRDGMTVARARFRLSEAEAHGTPAVLLWKNNAWIAPRPWFKEATANRAVSEIHLGGDEAVRAAVRQPKVANRDGAAATSLLHIAAGAGRVAAVEALLAVGAKPGVSDERARATPLEWAADRGRTEVAGMLDGPTNAIGSALRRGHLDTAATLARKFPKFRGRALGLRALEAGAPALAESLHGADASAMARDLPPDRLTEMVGQGHARRAQELLAHGIEVKNAAGAAALRLAAANGFDDLVRALLRAGVPADPADANEISALALAVRMGRRSATEALIAAGANPNRVTASGQAPLQLAVFADDPEMTTWLLAHGARVERDIAHGRSALHLALLWQQTEAIAALTRAGARIDLAAPNAPAVLAAAVRMDADDLIARALADGWRAATVEGGSALGAARACEASRVETLLRSHGYHASDPDLVAGADLEAAPEVIELPLPTDLRASNRAWPQTRVIVRGVIDGGRLRFPRIEGIDDHGTTVALANATTRWRFTVPQRAGRAVVARIALPVVLPAESRRVFSPIDVEAVGLQITPASREREEGLLWMPMAGFSLSPVYTLSPIWVNTANPAVRDIVGDLATGRPVVVSGTDLSRRRYGGRRALVNFVADEVGRPTQIDVTWVAEPSDRLAALEAVRRYRYTPALIGGRPVRVQATEWIDLN